jgi:ubiquitin C-terminal hydrolase
LDLPITANNLEDCIANYIKPETLTGDNAWYNEKTKANEDALKRIYFWNFPKILIIALKRFEYIGANCYRINTKIEAPLTNLDLSKYVDGYSPKKYVYDLYGVCNHMGGPSGGHYTAYVKNMADNWIEFNDDKTRIIENHAEIISPMSYCLFYRIRQ